MSRLRADLDTMAGVPAGSYVLPNTRASTDNFVLEYDNSGYVTIAWDEYRVAARTGYIVKRSQDEDGNDVDWSALTGYLWYWSGTVVTPNGRYTVTREPLLWYDEQQPTPPIDRENAINLELAYDAIVDTLLVAGGSFTVDERGFAFGDPPPTYDASSGTYSGTGVLGNTVGIVGVNAGVVQFEDRVSDGKRYAGAGAISLSAAGIQIEADNTSYLNFKTDSDAWVTTIKGVGNASLDGLYIGVNTGTNADAGQAWVQVVNQNGKELDWLVNVDASDNAYARLYTTTTTFIGLLIGVVSNFNDTPSSLLHLKSTAPSFRMEDSTASAKSLLVTVDGDKATFEEAGGTDIMVLDLANARVGIGTASPSSGYKLETSESILVNSTTNNSGFVARFTGSSSASVGPQSGFVTNDGAAMASADRIGALLFRGYDGSAEVTGAQMLSQTTEAWSGSARGSKLVFFTTPNGSTTLTAGMVLEQDATLSANGHINLASGKVLKVNATQVVGARDTGWTAMTGTPNEGTSYDTASVTLAQLAGRVMALQAALTAHGLIGA